MLVVTIKAYDYLIFCNFSFNYYFHHYLLLHLFIYCAVSEMLLLTVELNLLNFKHTTHGSIEERVEVRQEMN